MSSPAPSRGSTPTGSIPGAAEHVPGASRRRLGAGLNLQRSTFEAVLAPVYGPLGEPRSAAGHINRVGLVTS